MTMSEFYRTPQGISALNRQQVDAFHDQLAAVFAGDPEAVLEAQQREDEARAALLAIAEDRPS
jgi:hypothetical protein